MILNCFVYASYQFFQKSSGRVGAAELLQNNSLPASFRRFLPDKPAVIHKSHMLSFKAHKQAVYSSSPRGKEEAFQKFLQETQWQPLKNHHLWRNDD